MKPLFVHRAFAEGQERITNFWPAGATLADAGFRLSEPREDTHMDGVARVQSIANKKGISFEAALKTPEGARIYGEYRHQLLAQQESPLPINSSHPSRFDEARHFASTGAMSELRQFEERMQSDARARAKARNLTADATGISRMTNEILAEEPERYAEYIRLQRRGAGN